VPGSLPTDEHGQPVVTDPLTEDQRPRTVAERVMEAERLTPEKRRAAGRELRSAVPRGSHGEWTAPPDRPDPVSLLEEQARHRDRDLLPIRYGRMLDSPLAFLRGSANVMASDLAGTPKSGLCVQACGDAHLLNFGIWATPERHLFFGVNDFDESHPGPFEWDVKRLAASIVVAARDRGFADAAQALAARAAARTYREKMLEYAEMGFLDVWYSCIEVDEVLRAARMDKDGLNKPQRKGLKQAEKVIEKARARTNLGALSRFAEQVDGRWRIRLEPPLIVRDPATEQLTEDLAECFAHYSASLRVDGRELLSRYRFADFARKVVGVGSVGTQSFMVLLMGDKNDDPLFLQLKQAHRSVLEPFTAKSRFRHHGERVVTGQRLTQAASDSFLGWLNGPPGLKDCYVRQLRDGKGSADLDGMLPAHLTVYAELCGWNLARAHARTGDAAAMAGYLGTGRSFDHAIERFAVAYADQNEKDYRALFSAAEDGRIRAEEGV
jgi:uncharacterized protein (DUF2252 family)